jgi:hypothetical protein
MKRKNFIVVLLLCAMLTLSACGQKRQIVNLDDGGNHVVLEDSRETKEKFEKEKKASDNLLLMLLIALGIGISAL